MIDKQSLESETMYYITFLITRIRSLEAVVARLAAQSAADQGLQPIAQPAAATPVNSGKESADQQEKLPPKTVLLLGDIKLKQLERKIKTHLPQKGAVMLRCFSKPATESILEQGTKFLESNPQPVHLILHSGYDECMDFKKDKFLSSIANFAGKLKRDRPECSMSVISVPQFTSECMQANEVLKARKTERGIDVLDLTNSHRVMTNKGAYSYSSLDELSTACSKTIARRAAAFLGVKLVAVQPTRSPVEVPPFAASRKQAPHQRGPRNEIGTTGLQTRRSIPSPNLRDRRSRNQTFRQTHRRTSVRPPQEPRTHRGGQSDESPGDLGWVIRLLSSLDAQNSGSRRNQAASIPGSNAWNRPNRGRTRNRN